MLEWAAHMYQKFSYKQTAYSLHLHVGVEWARLPLQDEKKKEKHEKS